MWMMWNYNTVQQKWTVQKKWMRLTRRTRRRRLVERVREVADWLQQFRTSRVPGSDTLNTQANNSKLVTTANSSPEITQQQTRYDNPATQRDRTQTSRRHSLITGRLLSNNSSTT